MRRMEAEIQSLRLETDRMRRLEGDFEKLRLESVMIQYFKFQN